MAKAYVNFLGRLDTNGAQAFQGVASQTHRGDADVGANAGVATVIPIEIATNYVEIKATSGSVFACVMSAPATAQLAAAKEAAKIRIDAGEKITLAVGKAGKAQLYIWAAV